MRAMIIAVVVVAALVGAGIWIKSGEQTVDQKAAAAAAAFEDLATAEQAAGNAAGAASIRVTSASGCFIDRAGGIVTFRISLRNTGSAGGATNVRPWIGFNSGPPNLGRPHVRRVSVTAGITKSTDIVFGIDPRRRANRCRVYLGDGSYTVIAKRKFSA